MSDNPEVHSLWFEGTVASAVESAKARDSVLLVCLVEDTTEGSTSNTFERRFTEAKVASDLTGLNLVSLRLIKDSVDGIMFAQIFPVMVVPAVYLIRNGLLTDFMNSSVDTDIMLERIKKAVDGHFQIPPPPNMVSASGSTVPVETPQPAPTSGSPAIQEESISSPPQMAAAEDLHSTDDLSTPPAPTKPSSTGVSGSSTASTIAAGSSQTQALKDLMKERKLKREVEEREAAKQREIDRRASSKALTEAQVALKDKQAKKIKDQMEKEKREEAEYKRRVKQALEEDKARRKAEKEKAQAANRKDSVPEQVLMPTDIRTQNPGLAQARNDAAPALAFESSRLAVRLFDGSSIRNTFKATDTLEQVRQWINDSQPGSEDAYNIVQLIPSRTFTDESKMLRDLELCPSATLVLKKTATASSAYKGSGGPSSTLINYGWSALSLVGKAASTAYATASYYNPLAPAEGSVGSSGSANSSTNVVGGSSHLSSSGRSKKKDSEVSYNGNSTNLE